MKHIIVLFTLGVITYATVRIGSILSPDALALALGLLLGVLAGIPAALLVLAAQRQAHHQERPWRQIERYDCYDVLDAAQPPPRALTRRQSAGREWEMVRDKYNAE